MSPTVLFTWELQEVPMVEFRRHTLAFQGAKRMSLPILHPDLNPERPSKTSLAKTFLSFATEERFNGQKMVLCMLLDVCVVATSEKWLNVSLGMVKSSWRRLSRRGGILLQ